VHISQPLAVENISGGQVTDGSSLHEDPIPLEIRQNSATTATHSTIAEAGCLNFARPAFSDEEPPTKKGSSLVVCLPFATCD
jgi:hypothetical protein